MYICFSTTTAGGLCPSIVIFGPPLFEVTRTVKERVECVSLPGRSCTHALSFIPVVLKGKKKGYSPLGHLASSGDVFDDHDQSGAPSNQWAKARDELSTLQCTGEPFGMIRKNVHSAEAEKTCSNEMSGGPPFPAAHP